MMAAPAKTRPAKTPPAKAPLAKVGAAALALLLAALGTAFGVAQAATKPAAVPDPRPNIVFFTTDDMSVRDLRVMPNVQRLVTEQGTTFSPSYAPFPLCCPARAAWVTGQYNHNNGVMGNGGPASPEGGYAALDSTSTVATWLADAGYQTAMVGKFLNGYGKVKPIAVPPGWQEWHAHVGGGGYFTTKLRENTGGQLATNTYSGPHQVDLYTDLAVDVIGRRVPADAPLFLWVSQFAPHAGGPVEADDPRLPSPAVPPRWRDFYADTALPQAPSFDEADVSDKPSFVRDNPRLTPELLEQMREVESQRLEVLRAVDESVAGVVDALEASGELANTVFVFTSDNGHMAGEHRLPGGKIVPYEESARVPLIIRGPGFPVGDTLQALTANIDLAPTFADLARTTPGLPVDGRSLLPLVGDSPEWTPRTLVLEAGPNTEGGPDLYHGIRTARFKYLQHHTGEVEFYDLAADPWELTSLTDDPAYDDTQAALARELASLENCAGASCR